MTITYGGQDCNVQYEGVHRHVVRACLDTRRTMSSVIVVTAKEAVSCHSRMHE